MIPFKDLGDLEEDERIRQIGEKVINEKLVVGFITDADPGKLERYLDKLKKRFPTIRVIAQGDGPVAKSKWAKVGPPVN